MLKFSPFFGERGLSLMMIRILYILKLHSHVLQINNTEAPKCSLHEFRSGDFILYDRVENLISLRSFTLYFNCNVLFTDLSA